MTKVYLPVGDGMYKRIIVDDATEYLASGWFKSIADHQASLVEEKPKRRTRKTTRKSDEA